MANRIAIVRGRIADIVVFGDREQPFAADIMVIKAMLSISNR
jgi:hypothetical protein